MAASVLPLPRRPPAGGSTFAHTVRVYREFARVGFVNTLAYRLRYYTGIATYFIYVSVYYFIWKAIYTQSPDICGRSTTTTSTRTWPSR